MKIQNINDETVITIPKEININYVQNFIDYIIAKSIVSKSKATDNEINEISEHAQRTWWQSNKSRLLS